MSHAAPDVQALPVAPCRLGASPFWHPDEQALYWCDIPGRALHRFEPARAAHRHWALPTEPGCCAPMLGGGLMLAMRDGLWRFDTRSGERQRLAPPPYDPAVQRFNDGKADPFGGFWVGTIHEPREPALAALYRWDGQSLTRVAGEVTTSNGLGWSPDGRRLYWSDTKDHLIQVMDVDPRDGSVSGRRAWVRFPPRGAGQALADYGGRPDGAAVDSEGTYWVAMYEGQRLLRLAPDGGVLEERPLPVRCATMPCFGDDDLRTLYVTTAREGRPAEELAQQPWAGCVLSLRVDVPGLPAHFVRA